MDHQLHAGGRVGRGRLIDPFNPHPLEVAGVPDGVEVALDRVRIVGIALVAGHAGEDRVLGDVTLPNHLRSAQHLRPGGDRLSGGGRLLQDGLRPPSRYRQ